MKKAKNISIGILSAVCCVLAFICVYLTVTKDNTPPEINFDDIILSYTEGEDTGVLFTGVSASDLVDGDVTDRIIIKSITVEQEGIASVTYAVTDNSHNVTERSRRVIYRAKEVVTTVPPTTTPIAARTTTTTKKRK